MFTGRMGKVIKRIAAALALLLLCCQAHGDTCEQRTINLNLVNVVGPDSLNQEEALEVVAWAQSFFAQDLWIKLELVSYQEYRVQDFPQINLVDLLERAGRFIELKTHAELIGCKASGYSCYYMLPPLRDGDGVLYYGGLGDYGCIDAPFAYGQAGRLSSHAPPRDRIYASGLILAHEVSHGLDASHVPKGFYDSELVPPNIMDTYVGHYSDDYRGELHFIEPSATEISSCMGIANWVQRSSDRARIQRVRKRYQRALAQQRDRRSRYLIKKLGKLRKAYRRLYGGKYECN